MVIEIEARNLTSLFNDFIGNNKVMFNFKTDGRVVDVQVLDDYTACTTFECKSLDNDFTTIDISVWVTKFIMVLNSKEPIRFTITDAALFIEQSTFYCTLLREYEARREYPDSSQFVLRELAVGRLKYLIHSTQSSTPLAKELALSEPDPMFVNDRYYVDYKQTFFIDSFEFPAHCIPFSTLKSFAYKLKDGAKFCDLPEVNTVYFQSGKYEFWIPTTDYNINASLISAIDKKYAECMTLTDIKFVEYKDRLSVLSSAFPKTKMVFAVGPNAFNIGVDTSTAHMLVGYQLQKSLLSFNVTSAQLDVIVKLFGDEDKVEILRGANCICLRSRTKILLISVMIY